MNISQKTWLSVFFLTLLMLSMPMLQLNLGVQFRLGQLLFLTLFPILVLISLNKREFNATFYLILIGFVILMILTSLNSSYPKVKETTFFIKYLLIYTSIIFVAYRLVFILTLKNLILLLELSVISFVFFQMFLAVVPIPFLIHDRGGFTSIFQGTFFEIGWLANVLFFLTFLTVLLRIEYNIWPKSNRYLYLFYILVFIAVAVTHNKSVWIAIIISLSALSIYKVLLFPLIIKTDKNTLVYNQVHKVLLQINVKKLIVALFIFSIAFYFYNNSLDNPIISESVMAEKVNDERGKAFYYGVLLLQESQWLGGYGFGYIEYYFGHLTDRVIGLGEGSAVLFNTYLDAWVSTGIVGMLFHVFLLFFAFSMRSLPTAILPFFIFVMANFNAVSTSEWYYFYLGLLIGIKTRYVLHRKY